MAGYGKICTILLSQNRIRRDYEGFLVEAVGSDEEKEAFFREYRLKKQLVTVLAKNLNYGQVFQEHLSDGKILEALKVGLEHIPNDSTIPSHEVIMLLHYREFGKLLRILLGTSAGEKYTNTPLPQPVLPSSVSQALSDWDSFSACVRGNLSSLGNVLDHLGEGLYYDILCVAVSLVRISYIWRLTGCQITFHWLNLGLFEHMKTITNLCYIIHALRKTVDLWASIRWGQELPLPIAVVFGAFRHNGKPEISLLEYSPLQSEKSLREQVKVTLRTREKLLVQMIGLYDKLDDVAKGFWMPQNKKMCARHYRRGRFLVSHTQLPAANCNQRAL